MNRPQTVFVVEFSRSELAVRIAEACIGVKRPENVTAQVALQEFPPEVQHGFYQAADEALNYIHTCLMNGKRPS